MEFTNTSSSSVISDELVDALVGLYEHEFEAMELPKELHRKVFQKILQEQFDVGTIVQFAIDSIEAEDEDEDCEEESMDDIIASCLQAKYSLVASRDIHEYQDVFLIDHMWTTTFPQTRSQLESIPGLLKRVEDSIGTTGHGIDDTLEKLWSFLNPHVPLKSHNQNSQASSYSRWHLMDEVGISIRHSGTPNMKVHSLLVVPSLLPSTFPMHSQLPFGISIMWPVTDIEAGDIISRDFLPSVTGPLRELRLCGLLYNGLLSARPSILKAIKQICINVSSTIHDPEISLPETSNSSFKVAAWEKTEEAILEKSKDASKKLRIYCDRIDHLNPAHITRNKRIEIVNDIDLDHLEDIDIFYLIDHTFEKDGLEIELKKTDKILNQFWWEGLLVTKDSLAQTLKTYSEMKKDPGSRQNEGDDEMILSYFPMSYNLSNTKDLLEFILTKTLYKTFSKSVQLKEGDDSNKDVYIVKTFQGKQSVDYPITSYLNCTLRHIEIAPRLASRYILDPLLYGDKKFDLRYYVAVKSLDPLVIARHRQYAVRIANQPFQKANFESYQTHFTAMNFIDEEDEREELSEIRGKGERIKQNTQEFEIQFDVQYGQGQWKQTQDKIDKVIKDVFVATKSVLRIDQCHPLTKELLHPNAGWSLNQPNVCSARSMYGFDILLQKREQGEEISIEPILLEVQWGADAKKALEFHSSFWDDVLEYLYLSNDDPSSYSSFMVDIS